MAKEWAGPALLFMYGLSEKGKNLVHNERCFLQCKRPQTRGAGGYSLAKQKKPNTVAIARQLAEPVLAEKGLELWDVRYEKEGSSWFLRYFIEKEGGVNIQDCVDVSRAVEKLLDEADPIEGSYTLEVSSPGVERELVKDWHFQRYIGSDVHVRLIRPVEGLRDFTGRLVSKDEENITIELDEEAQMVFTKAEASYIKLYADFGIGGLEG